MFSPKFTIVVPTYNRLKYLPNCLEALLELDYPDYEIIIINDGSTDETKKYLDNLSNTKLKVFHNIKNQGLSFSKNRGAHLAQTDYIAFTDDDCAVKKDWLTQLAAQFTDNIDFVFGQTFYIKENYVGYFPDRMVQNLNASWPAGGNIAYKKTLFEKIGYFNSFFDYYHNEDSDLAIRAVQASLKYQRALLAIIYHQPMNWTVKSLLSSARNASVWVIFKKRYPKFYLAFNAPVKFNCIIHPKDYLIILTLPILIPVLLIRYLLHNKKDLKLFFTKWPIYILLRRYYIYKEAIKNRVLAF